MREREKEMEQALYVQRIHISPSLAPLKRNKHFGLCEERERDLLKVLERESYENEIIYCIYFLRMKALLLLQNLY